MKNIEFLSLIELLQMKEWLSDISKNTKIELKYFHQILKNIEEVNKEIWNRTISNDTPWGKVEDKIIINKKNVLGECS